MPKKTPIPLSQERIIEAAVRLLQRDGFDRFTMRSLAIELGVATGAVYRHSGGKENILALAADFILDDIRVAGHDEDWRIALTQNAQAYRIVFKRYPGVAAYLTMHLGETPVRQQAIKHSIGILLRAGQNKSDAHHTAAVLNAYIRASAGDGDAMPRTRSGRATRKQGARSLALDDVSFQHGLSLLIAGIEHAIHSDGSSKSP